MMPHTRASAAQLDAAIASARRDDEAAVPLLKAMRAGASLITVEGPCRTSFDLSRVPTPWTFIIYDAQPACGPAGFHVASLRKATQGDRRPGAR